MSSVVYDRILARYEKGHIYIDRTPPGERGREIFLKLGGVEDKEMALSLARRYLQASTRSTYAVAVEGYPFNVSQIPNAGFSLGDRMDGQLVNAIAMTLTNEDTVQIIPGLEDKAKIWLADLNRRIERANSGVTPEFGTPTIKEERQGVGMDTVPPPFSVDGVLETAFSPAWKAGRGFQFCWLEAEVVRPGVTDTICTVYKYRTSDLDRERIALIRIPAGETRNVVFVNEPIPVGWSIVAAVEVPGSLAEKLTMTLRGTMI